MDFRQIQDLLDTIRSGQIQKILATVLAIITAVGGIGLASSSNGSLSGDSNINSPGDGETSVPSGPGVPLANLSNSNSAKIGQIEVDGKLYENAIGYGPSTSQSFNLDSRYSVLKVTIVNTQKPAGRAEFSIGGKTYSFTEDRVRQTRTIDVSNINYLRTASDGGKFVLIDARVY